MWSIITIYRVKIMVIRSVVFLIRKCKHLMITLFHFFKSVKMNM